MRQFTEFEETNLSFLTQKNIEYTIVQITPTGFAKSILDATDPMRQYFKDQEMHDYSKQSQGTEHKVILPTIILDDASSYSTNTSLYRPSTKKGDPRIWPHNLKKHCSPDDILVMIYYESILYIINLSRVDFEKVFLTSIETPFKVLIKEINSRAMSVANELIAILRELAQKWHPSEVLADTGIGRAIESILGIEMNNSKEPDYKGIELKSYRDKRPSVRGTLFCQVPDWKNSHLKSAKEIVDKYGYLREGKQFKTYHNTLSCIAPNSQSLGLTLYPTEEILAIEEKKIKSNKPNEVGTGQIKVSDVAIWQLPFLHQRLLEKHRETFWIQVETSRENGRELFRPTLIEHTKNPIISQFDTLLDTGYITVDLLLGRQGRGGDTVSFKINKKYLPMLFPDSTTEVL